MRPTKAMVSFATMAKMLVLGWLRHFERTFFNLILKHFGGSRFQAPKTFEQVLECYSVE